MGYLGCVSATERHRPMGNVFGKVRIQAGDSKSVVSGLLNVKTEPYEILGLTDSGS